MRVRVEGLKGDLSDFTIYISALLASGKYHARDIADMLDVSPQMVWQWARGTNLPSDVMISRSMMDLEDFVYESSFSKRTGSI